MDRASRGRGARRALALLIVDTVQRILAFT